MARSFLDVRGLFGGFTTMKRADLKGSASQIKQFFPLIANSKSTQIKEKYWLSSSCCILKKVQFLILLAIFIAIYCQPVQAEVSIVTGDVPLSTQCCLNPLNSYKCYLAMGDMEWSFEKWGNLKATDWSPSVAGIQSNGTSEIRLRFYFTRDDVNFFKNAKFSGTNTRKPFALEFDIIDSDDVFGSKKVENDFTVSTNGFPDEVHVYTDVKFQDPINTMGVIITRPDLFETGKIYEIILKPKSQTRKTGKIHFTAQLTINYKYLAAMHNRKSSKCDVLDMIGDIHTMSQNEVNILSYNYFAENILLSAINGWYYFLAAKTDIANKISVGPDVKNEVCWNDQRNPRHDDSNADLCKNILSLSLFEMKTGDDFYGKHLTDGSSLVSENYPDNTKVTGGTSYTKEWTIKNTGTTTWNSAYKLKYVSNSGGRLSSTSEVAVSGNVSPNSSYTFKVIMNAPSSQSSEKSYKEVWKLTAPSGSTINIGNSSTVWAQIKVPAIQLVDKASFVSENYPDNTKVTGGTSYTKEWTIKNTGTTTWNSAYKLKYVSNSGGRMSSTSEVAVSGNVSPGSSYKFKVTMKAAAAGASDKTFKEEWKLTAPSGSTINIGNSSTVWTQIKVPAIQLVDKASFVSENYPDNTKVTGGTSYTKEWTIKNTGTTTWNSAYKLKYVSNSGGRMSSTSEVAVSGNVSPGSSYKFKVTMKAAAAGASDKTFKEEWKLTAPSGSTINIGNSSTVWAQIKVPKKK